MASQLQILAGTMADDGTGGSVSWTNPDNAKVSDGVYATVVLSSQGSHWLKATNFGFSIPSGATINGIIVEIEGKSVGPYCGFNSFLVKADGTISTTGRESAIPSTEAYISYGSSTDLWGETWDSTKINDVDFGVVSATPAFYNGTISIDHIRITVYYTEASDFFLVLN